MSGDFAWLTYKMDEELPRLFLFELELFLTDFSNRTRSREHLQLEEMPPNQL